MVKDRLADLRAKQNGGTEDSDGGKNDPDEPLLSKENWNSIDKFLERCSNANMHLKKLESCLASLRQIHHTILSQPGSDKELGNEQKEIVSRFTEESRRLRQVVKELNEEANGPPKSFSVPSEDANSVNNRIKKNQVRTISAGLCQVIVKFNSEQADYKEKHLQEITRYLKIQDHHMSEEEVLSAIEHGEIDNLTKGLMLAVADKNALFQEVHARHDQIIQMEESIREVHELFQDVHLLVLSQGEMIDNIEKNVQTAVDYADRAKTNVIGARNMQKRARKMKILICVGLVILAVILFFVLQGLVCHFTPIC